MRLGLNLGYWGADPARVVDVARHAEGLEFHSVWTAEAYGSDAIVPLAWVGAQTSKIGLGTAIMQMPARSPAMTAMTAVTLDLLSGGRALLGLGLVPTSMVPRSRMSAVIEEHHDNFTLVGIAVLLSVGIALAVTLIT